MPLKLVTWNVNSVRSHLDTVTRFVKTVRPDILCLQEIKVADAHFPLAAFRKLGFQHQAIHGQKAYHGVAILSREVPLAKTTTRYWCGREEARHVYCRIGDGIELHNFYVPAGGDVPDPERNDKFQHKLQFMQAAAAWFRRRRRRTNRFILVGDLNVAPLPTDVWSHKQLLKVVSHTPIEVEHLEGWYRSHDWVDAVRLKVPAEERLYSWWSYRARDWQASDRGRRLDHVWVTPALRDAVRTATVYKTARGWPNPSDHAPVVAEIEV